MIMHKTDSFSDWNHCIVTAYDLVGIKKFAQTGKSSSAMINMHKYAVEKINNGMFLHSNGYIWNDSVLLLSKMNEPNWTIQKFFKEVNQFKFFLEEKCNCQIYVISVKGLSFPHKEDYIIMNELTTTPSRAVVLRTSSWAMANCFLIEKNLKQYRADWYIDSRVTDIDSKITEKQYLQKPFKSKKIELLPKKKQRIIHMFKGNVYIEPNS